MATAITNAVQWLEANLPALKVLAAESEKVGAFRAEAQQLQNDIKALEVARGKIQRAAQEETDAAGAAWAKAKASQEAQAKTALSRLEDLQRQQQAYEDRLTQLRGKIEQTAKAHAALEADHISGLRSIEGQVARATAQLAETQDKIKALHANLAGTVA